MELNSSESRTGRLSPVQLTDTQTHGLLYVSRLQHHTKIFAFLCMWHLKTVWHAGERQDQDLVRCGDRQTRREAEHETDAHTG